MGVKDKITKESESCLILVDRPDYFVSNDPGYRSQKLSRPNLRRTSRHKMVQESTTTTTVLPVVRTSL